MRRKLERQGFEVVSESNHMKLRHPDGRVVMLPKSPGGQNRAMENLRAKLKRRGIEV